MGKKECAKQQKLAQVPFSDCGLNHRISDATKGEKLSFTFSSVPSQAAPQLGACSTLRTCRRRLCRRRLALPTTGDQLHV